MRSPSNVEPDAITLIEKLDARHFATDRRTYDVNEWKPEGNLFAAERTHQTAAAHAVEHHDHPFIKIVGETLAVENVAQFASSLIILNSRSVESVSPCSSRDSARLRQQLVKAPLTLESVQFVKAANNLAVDENLGHGAASARQFHHALA
jgi:hypothetical protein